MAEYLPVIAIVAAMLAIGFAVAWLKNRSNSKAA